MSFVLLISGCSKSGLDGFHSKGSSSNGLVHLASESSGTVAQTELTPSSGGSIVDSSGNVWSLSSKGEVMENGSAVPGGGGTSALTYDLSTNTIWAQDAASGGWYSWDGSQWNGPSSASPVQVVLTPSSGGSITDNSGNLWSLSSSGEIMENGNPVPGGSGSSALTYDSSTNTIWGQDAASGGWYSWDGSQWNGPSPTPVSLPDLIVTSVSMNPANPTAGNAVTFSAVVKNQGKAATPAGTLIGVNFSVDGTGVSWSASDSSSLGVGQSVTLTADGGPNGSATWTAVSGSHTVLANVDDVNRIKESEESNNQLSRSFSVTSAQTVLTRTSGGSIKDASGNVWTLSSSGQVMENGNPVPGGAGTSELTYVTSTQTIWGQDAATGNWYSWDGSRWNGPSPSPTPAPNPSPSPSSSPSPTAGLTQWYDNPGMDGGFWKMPLQTTAAWDTNSNQAVTLRNGVYGKPTGYLLTNGNFAAPWVIGTASDPVVTLTDGTKTIHIHIPDGTTAESMASTDNSIGGADATQPYLVWSCNNAIIDGAMGNPIHAGSTIECQAGMLIADGSGPIMEDAVTGLPWQASDNAMGIIQDRELSRANADPNYVIPHMLAYSLDPRQVSAQVVWPLKNYDPSLGTNGPVAQGYTIGIPAGTPRPVGKSRGFYLLFDNLQRYGWFFYNVNGSGSLAMGAYSKDPANAALVQDLSNSLSDVMRYVAILKADGSPGSQTGLSTLKGMINGQRSDAFPAPPLLDLSPTNGVHVLPSSFGAWYGTSVGIFYNTPGQ